MKKLLILVITLFITISTTFARDNISDDLKGYRVEGEKVQFIFNRKIVDFPEINRLQNIKVYIVGSFSSWEVSENYKMFQKNSNVWELEQNLASVNVPGNSGQSEFKFVVKGSIEGVAKTIWPLPPKTLPVGYKFSDGQAGSGFNYVILTENNNVEVAKKHKKAVTIKTDFSSREVLANFREVIGGQISRNSLFRSYHPFIRSRDYDIEVERISTNQQLIVENSIKSIINLTDTAAVVNNPNVPYFYKHLIIEGSVAFIPTDYKTVYWHSDSVEFVNLIKNIFKFIEYHEPPFLVHCRLGTDRTGVVTAFLMALMGASWDEIGLDYVASNETGMGEYRDIKLLEYTFTKLFNVSPKNVSDFSPFIIEFLSNNGITNIDSIKKKLSTEY